MRGYDMQRYTFLDIRIWRKLGTFQRYNTL
nr:MAG TPA: hypothetical protein [Caudoviricetes sp.]